MSLVTGFSGVRDPTRILREKRLVPSLPTTKVSGPTLTHTPLTKSGPLLSRVHQSYKISSDRICDSSRGEWSSVCRYGSIGRWSTSSSCAGSSAGSETKLVVWERGGLYRR